jgi:hypothetical protein
MGKTIYGIFMVLHGLVHLFYFGHSRRFFELAPDFTWPDGSWAFSKLLGQSGARNLASILLVLAAVGFVVGGIGVFANQGWWQQAVIGTSIFSALLFLLFWDGSAQRLSEKGGIGILINLAILAAILIWKWPNF